MKRTISFLYKQQLAIGLVILNTALMTIFTPNHYFFEMFQSMAFQLMCGTFILFLIFSVLKHWVSSLSSALAMVFFVLHLPLFEAPEVPESNCSIAHFNVLKSNNNFDQTIEAALDTKASFISFNEITPNWAEALEEGLKNEYPYSYLLPQKNSFGYALFSKHPLKDIKVHYWGSNFVPSISGELMLAGENVNFVAAHTIPPTSKDAFAKRNEQLQEISKFLSKIKGPKILVGDLNAVSWSEAILSLREQNQLKDSRTSWQPTFPSWWHLAAIPIDHILYSKELACAKFYTIKNTSSDHYGIVGEFYIHQQFSAK